VLRKLVPAILVATWFAFSHYAAHAARPAATVLPETTKGYLSVPDVSRLSAAWKQTELGQLWNDPALRPFVDDLMNRLRENLGESKARLGITLEDLRETSGGELCLAALEPAGEDSHALVVWVDVTGYTQAAESLLQRALKSLRAQEVTREKIGGLLVTVADVPPPADSPVGHQAYFIIHENHLLATDHVEAARQIIARWNNPELPSLASLSAYQATQTRTALEGGDVHSVTRASCGP
jgi:hypothetical protein